MQLKSAKFADDEKDTFNNSITILDINASSI